MTDLLENQFTAAAPHIQFQPRGVTSQRPLTVSNEYNGDGLACRICLSAILERTLIAKVIITGKFAIREVLRIKYTLINQTGEDLKEVTFERQEPDNTGTAPAPFDLAAGESESYEITHDVIQDDIDRGVIVFAGGGTSKKVADDEVVDAATATTKKSVPTI